MNLTVLGFIWRLLVAALLAGFAHLVSAGVILSENFEDGVLDPELSVLTVGAFNSSPGVVSTGIFGSTKAFGFGLSTCPFNCYSDHVTTLRITLPVATFVSTISYDEMELYDNWGSDGQIVADGVAITDIFGVLGNTPFNNRIADTTYRHHDIPVDALVTTIELQVRDITKASEIFLDNLVLQGGRSTSVAEPQSFMLLISGLIALSTLRVRTRPRQRR